MKVTFTRTSNTVSHSLPSPFPLTTGFCGIRLGSYALIPLPKFHLYNPIKQGWSTKLFSSALVKFGLQLKPLALPRPWLLYHSGLRFWEVMLVLNYPWEQQHPSYTVKNQATVKHLALPLARIRHSQKKKLNVKSITGNSGLMISVHC